MPSADPFDLQRFVTAQEPVFTAAVEELRTGRKRSHWMWFVFPQLRGLGSSSTAQLYGIGSLDEARSYLAHAILGPRLCHCTEVVLGIQSRSLNAIFGSPDDLKFCSSMTLFAIAAGDPASLFHQAIDRFCDGRLDQRTSALLKPGST
jgi:uncharacterized protein (DUF1810 family)